MTHLLTSEKDQIVQYDFGEGYGKLETGLTLGEASLIEGKLWDRYGGLFDIGFRFIRNCVDDPVEIEEAVRAMGLQEDGRKLMRIIEKHTYDSAGRNLEGYVAILVGPKR
jgi:hypothetical protein